MTNNNTFRHGDLVINKINKTDISLDKVKSAVLAEGEHTGHKHLLRPLDNSAQIEFKRTLDNLVFKVEGGRASLTHEEHKEIIFEPGVYEVKILREFDYFNEEIRQVLD